MLANLTVPSGGSNCQDTDKYMSLLSTTQRDKVQQTSCGNIIVAYFTLRGVGLS